MAHALTSLSGLGPGEFCGRDQRCLKDEWEGRINQEADGEHGAGSQRKEGFRLWRIWEAQPHSSIPWWYPPLSSFSLPVATGLRRNLRQDLQLLLQHTLNKSQLYKNLQQPECWVTYSRLHTWAYIFLQQALLPSAAWQGEATGPRSHCWQVTGQEHDLDHIPFSIRLLDTLTVRTPFCTLTKPHLRLS